MKIFLLLLTLFMPTLGFPGEGEGDKVLNGGDPAGLEFHEAAERALRKAEEKDPALATELRRHALAQILSEATILVVDELLSVKLAGAQQDSVAANEPATRRIYVQRARWQRLNDPILREALALHELAGLAGVEKTGSYPLSGRYLTVMGRNSGDLLKELAPAPIANSKYARSATLDAVRCTRHDKVFAEGAEHFLLGSEEGGAFTWEQEGKKLRLSFIDVEIEGLRDSLVITQTHKAVLQKNDLGQNVSTEESLRQFYFDAKKMSEQSGTYLRTIEWTSPTEGVGINTVNGVTDPRPVKLYEGSAAPGTFLMVNEFEPGTSAGEGKNEVRYLSSLASCTYERVPLEKIAEVLEPKMTALIDAMDQRVRLFDRALEALSLCRQGSADCAATEKMANAAREARDELWGRLVQMKEFDLRAPKIRKVVQRPSRPVRQARQRAKEEAFRGYDPETSRRLRELLDQGREEREREEWYRNRRQQDWLRDRHHRPVFSTPWGYKNHRGLPMGERELRDLVLGDKHYPNDQRH